ncbi:MAG: D-alanine--D-alanine ligase [Saprospiraceae bacterium]|nr:D-alanine--D-alanine ligase [Saprospiraceae bacterium]
MITVAILTGGPGAERGIALKSAELVKTHLDPGKYRHYTILLEPEGWFEQESGVRIDLNDFSLLQDGDRIRFDFVFLIIHGTPAEDGKLQGYFEYQNIPHSTCDTLTCALTFNKQWCKDLLRVHGVPMARSQVVRADQVNEVAPDEFAYPVFVKPNNNGSSYGVSRVETADALPEALQLAARYDHEIMIEALMQGREFSCGAVREGHHVHVFPLTEIIPDGVFFDYAAKYEGASQEITPANVEPELARKCQNLTARLYKTLNCKGMVRFDYILEEGEFKLLEVNTIPGLSEASIVPQQALAYGWTISHLLDVVVQDAMQSIDPH